MLDLNFDTRERYGISWIDRMTVNSHILFFGLSFIKHMMH